MDVCREEMWVDVFKALVRVAEMGQCASSLKFWIKFL